MDARAMPNQDASDGSSEQLDASNGADHVADSGGKAGDMATISDAAAGDAPMQPCEKNPGNTQDRLELITLSTACMPANGDSSFPHMTPDGRYVVFQSEADDLVPNDLNGRSDDFLVDLDSGKLELLSKKVGTEVPSGGDSFEPIPSDDARYIAFTAYAYDLTSLAPTTGGLFVYLRDRQAGTTRRLPADYACGYRLDMSGDAKYIVVEGLTNCQGALTNTDYYSVLEYDVRAGTDRHLGVTGDRGDNYRPAISRDGRFVVWAIQPPMTRSTMTAQIQVFDRNSELVETLPIYAFGYESIDIADDGNVVALSQNGQVYRYMRNSRALQLVSKSASGAAGDRASTQVSLSGDGRYLVFTSAATNLVEGDTNEADDIMLFDASSDRLERISVAPDGVQADGDSRRPFISGNGAKVSFTSKARNLPPLAKTGDYQLYIRTLDLSL